MVQHTLATTARTDSAAANHALGCAGAGFVFAAVLFAAACHAGWNALIKVGLDPLSTTILIRSAPQW
jgi:hypothetical protein